MDGYNLPFIITNTILSHVASVSEKSRYGWLPTYRLLNQMTNSATDDANLDANGANQAANNMEGKSDWKSNKICELVSIYW